MAQKRKVAAAGGSSKRRKAGSDGEGKPGQASAASAVALAAELDAAERGDEPEAAEAAAAQAAQEGGTDAAASADVDPATADPYLLADATYIEKDTRWRNKQRTLVFCSRGVTSRFRHLCEDVRKLLPHHKPETKFDKKSKLHDINEVCELKSCNNVIFFESRKMQDLYMWVSRVPAGPSMKFQVLNIHTTQEVRLAGNCLLGSRPILYFDKAFSELSQLQLIKGLFVQAFGTPRNHPKSKPFHDHAMCFYWLDGKIWFRHYQIAPETPACLDDPERQVLTEIGPRFVLDPIIILAGSFSGQSLYQNATYLSPTAKRVQARHAKQSPYAQKIENRADRKERIEANRLPEDPLEEVFI